MSDTCGPMDCTPPGFFVHGILQQEYWSGLPFSSPGDLLDPGIEPGSPTLQADSLPTELSGNITVGSLQFLITLDMQVLSYSSKIK